jgi:hypothetical protein
MSHPLAELVDDRLGEVVIMEHAAPRLESLLVVKIVAAAHGIGTRLQHAEEGMAGFVIRGTPPLLLRNDDVAGGPELHFLKRLGKVALMDGILTTTGREQCGLVHQVREVGTGLTRRFRFGRVDMLRRTLHRNDEGARGQEVPPTGKSFEVDFCTVARWRTERSSKRISSTTSSA